MKLNKAIAIPAIALAAGISLAACGSVKAPAATPTVTHTVTAPAAAPKPTTPAPTTPAPTTPAPAPVKTVVQAPAAPAPAAPAAPAAPPADQIITRFNGTGMGNTGTFTVPTDGNWHLSWEFTNGSLFAGQSENFVVTEYTTDGSIDNVLVNALSIGNGTDTATPVYSDSAAGEQVYLSVNTEDASWSLVPVTGTS